MIATKLFSRRWLATAALLGSSLAAAPAYAYDAVYFFGDSLSDTGTVTAFTGSLPLPPYATGRFSNGPVWADGLAAGLGLSSEAEAWLGAPGPAYGGGFNYAVGGARTGTGGFIPGAGLLPQIDEYLMDFTGTADADALFSVWAGGNDVRSNQSVDSVTNILAAITNLANAGAVNFLVPNLPDIGLTPESLAGDAPGGSAALMSMLTADFNAQLATGLTDLGNSLGLNIIQLDVAAAFADIIANPGSLGFTNVTEACFTGTTGIGGMGDVCANPGQYLFWDGIHPTAAGHAVLAEAALAAVVPIPAGLWLLGSALLGMLGFRRRA